MSRKVLVILVSGIICLLGVTSALAVQYSEAPMLRTKVAAGELPSVEKRLPENPKIVKVYEEIGQYGGELYLGASSSASEIWQMQSECLTEPYPLLGDNAMPNVAQGWEVSEDGKVYTFHLRKGMKWSDGAPFTTEDVLFCFEDYLLNEKLVPVFPKYLTTGGEPMKLEVIDDYTFRIEFTESYGIFPLAMYGYSWKELYLPKHYLKSFHADYTPLEEIEPLIKEAGYGEGEWWRLFQKHRESIAYPGGVRGDLNFPTLAPWIMTRKPTPQSAEYVRNPYYWKVDAEGNQLPYVDKVFVEIVADLEVATMMLVAGEINFARERADFTKMPIYQKYAEEAGFRVLNLPSELATLVEIDPNFTYPDPVWREVIADIRFRRALALGINREEINQTLFLGFGRPVQTSLAAGSSYMIEELADRDIQYDPATSNKLLDEMGLDKRDADGWRLGPDGNTLKVYIESLPANPYIEPVLEMVVEYWRDLGIYVTLKMISIPLWFERFNANEIMMFSWHQCNSTDDTWVTAPWHWVPYSTGFGRLWAVWYQTNGKEGDEPPAEVKRLYELYELMLQTTDLNERREAGREIVQSQADNIWRICTVGDVLWPLVVVPENMRNVPDEGFGNLWVPLNLEQAFFKQ